MIIKKIEINVSALFTLLNNTFFSSQPENLAKEKTLSFKPADFIKESQIFDEIVSLCNIQDEEIGNFYFLFTQFFLRISSFEPSISFEHFQQKFHEILKPPDS